MTTTLVFIRHGETVWNATHRMQGQTDIPLSPTGRKQAEQTARQLRHYPIRIFYSSPLQRAQQTAGIIARFHPDAPHHIHDLLKERSFGRAEGMTYEEIAASFPVLAFNRSWHHPYFQIPGGERLIEVYERGKNFLRDIRESQQGKIVGVVAHGVIIRCMISFLLDLPLPNNYFYELNNTSCTIIGLPEAGPAQLHVLNSTIHLD